MSREEQGRWCWQSLEGHSVGGGGKKEVDRQIRRLWEGRKERSKERGRQACGQGVSLVTGD